MVYIATAGVADTHALDAAGVPEPVSCVVNPVQTFSVPVIVGSAFTVTVAVMVQPLLLVYVITLVPAETPVTNPVLLTVATDGVADTHALDAAGVPEPVSCVVNPVQTFSVPVIVGSAFTVTVAVMVQPLLLVYVITLVPAETPVTNPVLLTVATDGVADTHALDAAGVPEPVSCVVNPVQTFSVPVIVGSAFTVTVAVMVQPLLLVYVITLVPAETPVTNPVLLTVATDGVADTHALDAAGVPEPVSCVVNPLQTFSVPVIVGSAFTVTVAVMVQPLLLVYVTTLVPAETPVTNPVLLTVATAGVADTHALEEAGVADPVSCVVNPVQTFSVPVIVGSAFTVTVAVMVQPLLLVYVITLVPAETPVTNPVLLTVATDGVADTHALDAAGVPEPVSCVVNPVQTFSVPVIVGSAFTVTVAVMVQPLLLVYVTTLVPAETPVTNPVLVTVATPGDADTHGLTAAAVPEPVNCVVDPIQTFNEPVMVGNAFTVTVVLTCTGGQS